MSIFATSDHHFFHRTIIKYANRPFTSDVEGVFDTFRYIVDRHNSVVSPEDTVYFVGDLTCIKELSQYELDFLETIINNMNGEKILIRGNHDNLPDHFYTKTFTKIMNNDVIGSTFICHYPCFEHDNNRIEEKEQISILKELIVHDNIKNIIHGHVHNKDPDLWEKDGFKRYNVCVDFTPNKFTPIKIDDIINF